MSRAQLLTHTINLNHLSPAPVGHCQLLLLIEVAQSHIATDIRTGFPQLMLADRRRLLEYVEDIYLTRTSQIKIDLSSLLSFIEEIKQELPSFVNQLEGIKLQSLSFDFFLDLYDDQASQLTDGEKFDQNHKNI
ncbi:hypothetical protein [Eremococcus coleocola]|uniref:Uncharacterized protein n=1 Tax=Eremococcus coleocola ACS-139-V-Col8 TaxID=908337 RepID=E4KQE4_9LACT|nr:hypothetical protein [Eremococcus coleocola]EFR30884.1 hypothetical protein HMPREF9257_1745 [Eremococcus coleocola ACS-139-V-Col8]